MQTTKILILTANPELATHDPLRLDREIRYIQDSLRRSEHREQFELVTRQAARALDLRRSLLEERPQIVHFSGHGSGQRGLMLEDEAGEAKLVSTNALEQLFSHFDGQIDCLLLNACYSEVQAQAIHKFVDYVIGMNRPIGDTAAIQFAEGFYDALGAGCSYEKAFELGRSAIALEGSNQMQIPELLKPRRQPARGPFSPSHTSSSAASPIAEAESQPTPSQATQSQSLGNVTMSGSNNPFNVLQSQGDITLDQSQQHHGMSSTNTRDTAQTIRAAQAALEELSQAVARASDLDETDCEMAQIPLKKLTSVLQQSPFNTQHLKRNRAALQRTLTGFPSLAAPLSQTLRLLEQLA